jgi:hypothetical protein
MSSPTVVQTKAAKRIKRKSENDISQGPFDGRSCDIRH